jgi:uncharacterized protein
MDIATILSGFGVGMIVGLTGVGGGSLMTPLLIGWLGVPPAIAVGTDLIFAGITKGFGALAHARHAQVDWLIVTRMVTGSVAGALLTLLALKFLGNTANIVALIRPALGVALLLTACAVLFRHKLHAVVAKRPLFKSSAAQATASYVLAFIIGIIVTLSSVGAGAIGVTALLLIYPLLHTRVIVGSDIAYAVPLTLVAGLGHVSMGHFDGNLLITLLVGSLPGIWIGSKLSTFAPEGLLRTLLCGCLVFAGVKILL